MKRKNIFPLIAGIFLIYLLCSLTYKGGNQEGFIEGFLEGQAAADPSAPITKCTATGKKAYQAWKECYDAYSNVCSKENAYKKYGFCKSKIPCAELRRQFNVHKKLCEKLQKKKQEAIEKFRKKVSQQTLEEKEKENEEEQEEEKHKSTTPPKTAWSISGPRN